MSKESFRSRFMKNYEIAKQVADEAQEEYLKEANQKGGFTAYSANVSDAKMQGLPSMLADGTVALYLTIKQIIQEKRAEKQIAEKSPAISVEAGSKNIADANKTQRDDNKAEIEVEKTTASPKLEPIDFSKIDFNHDGKPDIEQNIEEVMKVDVKQYVKEENTRDYIGDFDFAEDEPEIQEAQQVVQNYRSNKSRDNYDRDER